MVTALLSCLTLSSIPSYNSIFFGCHIATAHFGPLHWLPFTFPLLSWFQERSKESRRLPFETKYILFFELSNIGPINSTLIYIYFLDLSWLDTDLCHNIYFVTIFTLGRQESGLVGSSRRQHRGIPRPWHQHLQNSAGVQQRGNLIILTPASILGLLNTLS